MGYNNNRKNETTKIPTAVKNFAKASYKKHKKEWRDMFDSKKALRKDYFDQLIVDMPEVIEWLLTNSHKQQDHIQEMVAECRRKFVSGDDGPDFIAHITKLIKDYGVDEIPNIEYFPIILGEIIADIIRYNSEHSSSEEKMEGPDDLYKLSTTILKKRIKKAMKKGIPEDITFDILSIVPMKDAIRYGQYFRAKQLLELLYVHAETVAIPFNLIMKTFVDDEYYKFIIGYALQERKDKYRKYNELQKKLFNDITTWIFDELEQMSDSEIRKILNNYIGVRKRDAANGKDSNRRYYISSLPKSDYPNITGVVEELLSNNAENKKYL